MLSISSLQTAQSAVSSSDSEIRGRYNYHRQGYKTVDLAKDETLVHEPVIWIFLDVGYLDGDGLFHDGPGPVVVIFVSEHHDLGYGLLVS